MSLHLPQVALSCPPLTRFPPTLMNMDGSVSAISLNEEQILSVTLSIHTILMLALSSHAYASSVLLVNVSGLADRHVTDNTGRKAT